MKKTVLVGLALCAALSFSACAGGSASSSASSSSSESSSQETSKEDAENLFEGIKLKADTDVRKSFMDVSVHDPSVLKVGDTYYIFGSHLAAAKTTDLMHWTLIDSGVKKDNKIIPDAMTEMKEAFDWAKTTTFWAPDVIQLEDGKFYMYYCNCEGSSPLSALGVAVSDNVEGPYKNLGIILKSGMGADIPSEDGDTYNASVQPNAIDPCVFYGKDGRLWMSYGSYSGGIFVLELNPKTGMPLQKGYGKKILGANHLRIEGSYVMYNPQTDYYYMFLSYGGLASDGGYNIRVCRSKNPDGPYYDSQNQDMINCKGPNGSFFNDAAAAKYGVKLMGNYRWNWIEGENGKIRKGLVSPGHNSAIFDESTGKYFLIFHTRFENSGEAHEVRVHQMFFNENGWPVVAPYRYAGETIVSSYDEKEITGPYKFINHMNDTTKEIRGSSIIWLNSDHTISGDAEGTWKITSGANVKITIKGIEYSGVFLKQWDEYGLKNVMTFTVQSEKGVSLWGSGIAALD